MLRLMFVLLGMVLWISSANAKIVSDTVYSNIRLGPHFIRRALPGERTETITAYSLTYFRPVYKRLRLEFDLFHAPDRERRSRQLKVQQDWRAVALGLDLSYPKLFRWNAGFAVMGLDQTTDIQFTSESGRQSRREGRLEWLPRLRLGVDYAINQSFEISTYFLYWRRQVVSRTDWSWGVGLSYNFGAVKKRMVERSDPSD